MKLEDFWKIINEIGFISHKKLNSDYISFNVDYPHRGILNFVIEFYDNNFMLVYDWRDKILNECSKKEIVDKITYLVEGL
jgi:hypothetical protein